MTQALVRYESSDGIATITLDRPDKRNAMNPQLVAELQAAWERFNADEQDHVAILAGAGQSFTAGADLKDMPAAGYGYVPGIGVTVTKPIISAIQGWCVGVGMILVMQSDLCVAADDARFLYPEAKLGLGRGLMASLAGRIPPKVAAEVMLLGEPVAAARMEQHGFVNAVVPLDQLMVQARAWAAVLADREPVVNEFYKHAIDWITPKGPGEIAERTRWLSNHLPGHRAELTH